MLVVGGGMVVSGQAVVAHTVKDKDDDTAAPIGLGFIVSDVVAAISGEAARPAADVRTIEALPHSIFLATDRTDGADAPQSVPGAPVQPVHDGGACQFVWAHDRKLASQLPARTSASIATSEASGARGRKNKWEQKHHYSLAIHANRGRVATSMLARKIVPPPKLPISSA